MALFFAAYPVINAAVPIAAPMEKELAHATVARLLCLSTSTRVVSAASTPLVPHEAIILHSPGRPS
jgi:hypothetical protein